MESQAVFGSERQFELKHAILLYYEKGASARAATIHNVGSFKRQSVLGPGAPVTLAAVEELAIALGRRLENTLLPERMLAISMSRMVWWCPAARRRIWFNPAVGTQSSASLKSLKKLNGKFVQHPALLFAAGVHAFQVFALADDRRPNASTRVYRAPYYNLGPNGTMCEGTVRLPDTIGPSAMEAYELAFFNSAFSHSNWGHKLTRHPGAHLGLWQEMTQRKSRFPTRYLVQMKTTLQSIIKGTI